MVTIITVLLLITVTANASMPPAQIHPMSAQEFNDSAQIAAEIHERRAELRANLTPEQQEKINTDFLTEAETALPLIPIIHYLDQGANINATKAMNETALNSVIDEGHEVVKLLLVANANPNTMNSAGFSPLYRSILHGYQGVEKILVLGGADPYLTHKNNFYVLKWASETIRTILLDALKMRQNVLQRLDRATLLLHGCIAESPALSVIDYTPALDTYLYFDKPTDEFLNILIAQKWLAIKKEIEIARALQQIGLPTTSLIDIVKSYCIPTYTT